MSWKQHEYDAIPGTYVFDGKNAFEAYGLNKLLYSFNHAENRAAFADDPEAYADRFDLTPAQRDALLGKDFLQMLRLGANIYYVAKMAIPNGVSVQDAGAAFQGITTPEFQAKLDAHAEGLLDKLEKAGGFWNG
jgi:protocatechuate 4,5-dioxygenase alpha chain